jgi:hypothetical protein
MINTIYKMTKSSAKNTTTRKSSKATKGSVGFIHGGTFRQGLFRIFKSDDKDPSETLTEFHEYYGQKLSGRYVNVESVDEIYEKFLEHYEKEKVNGTETVFKTSTMKSVCDTLKEIAEVSKCHLIKSDSSEEGDDAEEGEEAEEKEEKEEKETKSSKSSKSSKKEETKPKQSSSKKAKKEESEDEEKSESEHSEQEEEEEEEKPAPKSSKGKTPAKKGKADKKDDDSDDEGEKLQKKSKSAADKGKKSGKGK